MEDLKGRLKFLQDQQAGNSSAQAIAHEEEKIEKSKLEAKEIEKEININGEKIKATQGEIMDLKKQISEQRTDTDQTAFY